MTDAVVILTRSELHIAASVALQRQVDNLMKDRPDAHGCDPAEGWQKHVDGALGELVLAKWLNEYWSGNLGKLDANDVGRREVRSTTKPHGSLILHRTDPDDRPFILVTGVAPRFVLRGWLWGREGKQEKWWSDPQGRGRFAFFVPQSELRPMRRAIEP